MEWVGISCKKTSPTLTEQATGAATFFFRYIHIIILLLNFNKFQNVKKMLSKRAYIGFLFYFPIFYPSALNVIVLL